MNKYRIVLIVILIVAAVFTVRFCVSVRQSDFKRMNGNNSKGGNSPNTDPSHKVVISDNPVARLIAAYKTPIEFYGKVVDQHGAPVVGAAVMLLPFDNMGESSRTKMMLRSDEQGGFSIKGLTGLAMGVQVTKDGYMTLPDLGLEKRASSRRIEYGLDGTGGKRFKNPSKPTLFTLIKIGPLEPMAYTGSGRIRSNSGL